MIRTSVIVAAAAALVWNTPISAQEPGAGDTVVAIVDGAEVRRSELDEILRSLPQQYQQIPQNMLYGLVLERAVELRLIANEAERLELGDDPSVQPALAQARAGVLRDALVRQKIDEGMSEETLRARFEARDSSDEPLREEVHARHILLESEEDAREVITSLDGGADFAALAQERSIGPSAESGGDLGYFQREQMVPEFAEAAFAMDVGSHSSDPVQTQFGWHVIMVVDKRESAPSFEETEPQLRQEAAREIVMALVEELRENADIQRFGPDGTPLPDPPPEGAAPEAAPPAE